MTGPQLKPAVSDRDYFQGRNQAPVTLVEYGDYECPHCGRAYAVVKHVQEVLGEQLRLVFRNFPLAQVHPHAEIAAEAAEAAGAQGRFWEMHDQLFENQGALEPDDLISYANSIDLDIERFIADLNGRKFANRVADDFKGGLRSGVNGSPTFFINGFRNDGSWEFESLLNAIQVVVVGQVAKDRKKVA